MFTYSSVDCTQDLQTCIDTHHQCGTAGNCLCCCMSFYFARATNTTEATRSRNFVFLFVFCDSCPFCWSLPSIPSPPRLSQLLRKLKLQQHLQYKEQLYCFDPQVSACCLHWGHQSQLFKQHQPPAPHGWLSGGLHTSVSSCSSLSTAKEQTDTINPP